MDRKDMNLSGELSARWLELAALPDDAIDLAEGAMLIAAPHRPHLRAEQVTHHLDTLAATARRRLSQAADPLDALHRLMTYLFLEAGFRGNSEAYDEPTNSYLDVVLECRLGLPVTLSIVTLEVGRRVGVPLAGVSFPGHFLVKHMASPDVYADPFGKGQLLTSRDCKDMLARHSHEEPTWDPAFLEPVSARTILLRMLKNLKAIFVREDNIEAAIIVIDQMLVLAPHLHEELRDRGLLKIRDQAYRPALDDLERYLAMNPADPNHHALQVAVASTRRRLWALN